MTYWLTDSFKALQTAWYQRLEKEGFVDAEEIIDGDPELKQNAEHAYLCKDADMTLQQYLNREEYFHRLSHHVSVEDFDTEIDRLILSLYAEGTSKRRIAGILRKLAPRRPPAFVSDLYRSRKTVWYRICVYEMRWGLREFSTKYFQAYSAPGDRHKKAG